VTRGNGVSVASGGGVGSGVAACPPQAASKNARITAVDSLLRNQFGISVIVPFCTPGGLRGACDGSAGCGLALPGSLGLAIALVPGEADDACSHRLMEQIDGTPAVALPGFLFADYARHTK
jgi:hypothetical protein